MKPVNSIRCALLALMLLVLSGCESFFQLDPWGGYDNTMGVVINDIPHLYDGSVHTKTSFGYLVIKSNLHTFAVHEPLWDGCCEIKIPKNSIQVGVSMPIPEVATISGGKGRQCIVDSGSVTIAKVSETDNKNYVAVEGVFSFEGKLWNGVEVSARDGVFNFTVSAKSIKFDYKTEK